MTDQTPAQRMIGDFAPKLVELTDEVLFGDVWARPEPGPEAVHRRSQPVSGA